jgi:hypothetical protein
MENLKGRVHLKDLKGTGHKGLDSSGSWWLPSWAPVGIVMNI